MSPCKSTESSTIRMCFDCGSAIEYNHSVIKGPSQKEIQNIRRLLAIVGVVYMVWWIVVEILLPQSFNPLLGRALVGLACLTVIGLSFVNDGVLRRLGLARAQNS